VDSNGNVFVADTNNQIIRKITPAGTVSTFAGQRESGFCTGSRDGTGTAARFCAPNGITVDANDNVYVTDRTSENIRKITPGGVVTTVAGGIAGCSETFRPLCGPNDIAVAGDGTLYISQDYSLTKIPPGGAASFLLKNEFGLCDPNKFCASDGIAMDAAGNLLIANMGANRLLRVTPAGQFTIFGTGFLGSADGSLSTASFRNPKGIAVDQAGNIYVADTANHMIRKISP
jgi:sugar lactone lactonase YvrE